jgi:hypothetical protein
MGTEVEGADLPGRLPETTDDARRHRFSESLYKDDFRNSPKIASVPVNSMEKFSGLNENQ